MEEQKIPTGKEEEVPPTGFVARWDGQTTVQRVCFDGQWFYLGDRVRHVDRHAGGTIVGLADRPQADVFWDDGERCRIGLLRLEREEGALNKRALYDPTPLFRGGALKIVDMTAKTPVVPQRCGGEAERAGLEPREILVPIRGQPGLFRYADDKTGQTTRAELVDMRRAPAAPPTTVPATRHYPGTCTRCGGDAYVGLLSIECAAGPACAPPREPEPAIVEVVTINYTSGHRGLPRTRDVYTGDLAPSWPGMAERAWRARDEGESPGPSSCLHPTREGAVELWRERRAFRERADAYIRAQAQGALRGSPSGIR